MFFMIANIVFASAFTLCIKWAHVRKTDDPITVGLINYIVAAVLIVPDFYRSQVSVIEVNAALSGATMGICYLIAFFFVNYAVRYVGASSSTVVAVLSMMVPIAFGVLLWNERPNTFQIAGIVFATMSLWMVGSRQSRQVVDCDGNTQSHLVIGLMLVGLFVLAGMSRLAQEAFKHISDPQHRPTFLFVGFVAAAIPSFVILLWRGRRVSLSECALGLLMGASNIIQAHYLLRALESYDGFIVFPVVSAGSLALTAVVATKCMGEQLTRKTVIGITTAVVALVLLNQIR